MTISATNQGLRPGVCVSTARPSTPFDGMMIYETDTNLVRIWNGSAWKTLAYSDYTSGSVIQVASTTKTDTFSTSSTTFVDLTGLNVSITPTSSSSKVLVMANIGATNTTTASGMASRLVRDSTAIALADAASSRTQATKQGVTSGARNIDLGFTFLDSPATTSSITYKVQVMTGNAGTLIAGASGDDTNFAYHPRGITTITVMEIAG